MLETPNGCIFESGAIARYVARLRSDSNLLGATNFQQAQVDQWIDFCNNEVEPARGIWIYPIQGYIAYNEKAYAEAKKEMTNALTVLNNHLLANTFLVGNAVTLADITIGTALGQTTRHTRHESRSHCPSSSGLHLVSCLTFHVIHLVPATKISLASPPACAPFTERCSHSLLSVVFLGRQSTSSSSCSRRSSSPPSRTSFVGSPP